MRTTRALSAFGAAGAVLLAAALIAGCAAGMPETPGLGGSDGLALEVDANALDLSTTTDELPPERWPEYLPFPDLPKGHPVRLASCFDPADSQPGRCHFLVYELRASDVVAIDVAYRSKLRAEGWEWVQQLDIWQKPDELPGRYIRIFREKSALTFAVDDMR